MAKRLSCDPNQLETSARLIWFNGQATIKPAITIAYRRVMSQVPPDQRRLQMIPRNHHALRFWFILSLVFAFAYSLVWLKVAFAGKYVMQTDASMYVFWMQRLLDPERLPHDLNVAYHASISPVGYTALYRCAASLGIAPLLFNKLLAVGLTLTTTAYCFGFCLQILPAPAVAFVSTLLLNQHLWLTDDVNSATPRTFVYPFFFAFLYYLGRGSKVGAVGAIAAVGLLGLFYPSMMFVAIGVLALRLVEWANGKLQYAKERDPYLLLAAGIGVAVIVMLPYSLGRAEFGSLVTLAEARTMPEFLVPSGRIPFFNDSDRWSFWLSGTHSGLGLSLNPPIVSLGLLLPLLWRYPRYFPLTKQCSPKVLLLPQICVAALGFFLAAHGLLFRLFLPSRYTLHSLRMVVAIAGGLALCILLDAAWRVYQRSWQGRQRQYLAWGAAMLVAIPLVFYPQIFWAKYFTKNGLVVGGAPALYEFFQQQPKDSLIATLSGEADNLPVFAQRSVLASAKYAIPYHPVYYNQIRQRAIALLRAQYSPDLATVQQMIQTYGIDFWLLERTAFTPDYLNNHWLKLFEPANAAARAHLLSGKTPALAQVMERCSVFETEGFVVLQAACLTQSQL